MTRHLITCHASCARVHCPCGRDAVPGHDHCMRCDGAAHRAISERDYAEQVQTRALAFIHSVTTSPFHTV